MASGYAGEGIDAARRQEVLKGCPEQDQRIIPSLQESPETNLAWPGSINNRAYKHYIAEGAADECDHIELSGLSNLARRT